MSTLIGSHVVSIAPAEQALPLAADRGRIVGIDLWRFFAALAIIWVHVLDQPVRGGLNLYGAGFWGTAFLNLLAGYFVAIGVDKAVRTGKSVRQFAAHRAWRIGRAFVMWCLIYLLVFTVFQSAQSFVRTGATCFETTLRGALAWPGTLFFGTTLHLWFLPYLVVVTLLSIPVLAFAVRTPERSLWFGAAFAAAAVGIIALAKHPMTPDEINVDAFVTKTFIRSPGFMLGLAFGLWALHGRLVQPGWGTVCACIAVLAGSIVLGMTTDLPRSALDRAAAVAAFIAAQAPWRGPVVGFLARLGSIGFGVYLAHVLFVKTAWIGVREAGLQESLGLNLALVAIVAVGSFAFVAVLRRTPGLRWLIP